MKLHELWVSLCSEWGLLNQLEAPRKLQIASSVYAGNLNIAEKNYCRTSVYIKSVQLIGFSRWEWVKWNVGLIEYLSCWFAGRWYCMFRCDIDMSAMLFILPRITVFTVFSSEVDLSELFSIFDHFRLPSWPQVQSVEFCILLSLN